MSCCSRRIDVPPVVGGALDGYGRVKDVFEDLFFLSKDPEQGASLCVMVEDVVVVSVAGGWQNREKQIPFSLKSKVNTFSCGKQVAMICIAKMVGEGLCAYEDLVSKHWPEFAQNGKESITIEMVMLHKSGLGQMRIDVPTMSDLDKLEKAVEAAKPVHLGKAFYHAFVYADILSCLIRRITGRPASVYFRDEIGSKIGAEVSFRNTPGEDNLAITYACPPCTSLKTVLRVSLGLEGDRAEKGLCRAMLNPMSESIKGMYSAKGLEPHKFSTVCNESSWHQDMELVSASGVSTAEDWAKVMAMMAANGEYEGEQIIRPQAMEKALTEHEVQEDILFRAPMKRVSGGWMTTYEGSRHRFSPADKAYVWPGMGGSHVFFDQDNKIAFAYCTNSHSPYMFPDRVKAAIDMTYECFNKVSRSRAPSLAAANQM
eukprot:GFYU01010451.1.p1 GENE.GFYU01010451.1~~GFYU01010451.1.p1  ORF type:complete len:429 (+),score=79.72 GFYU01010451.1:159-1445(+)